MAARFMAHPDFTEGVTARLMNKPPTKPNWQPATLEEVTDEKVQEFFTLPSGVEPLELTNTTKERQEDYREYPWAHYGLPRDADIKSAVKEAGDKGRDGVLAELESKWHWKGKLGVREKLDDWISRNRESMHGQSSKKDSQKSNL